MESKKWGIFNNEEDEKIRNEDFLTFDETKAKLIFPNYSRTDYNFQNNVRYKFTTISNPLPEFTIKCKSNNFFKNLHREFEKNNDLNFVHYISSYFLYNSNSTLFFPNLEKENADENFLEFIFDFWINFNLVTQDLQIKIIEFTASNVDRFNRHPKYHKMIQSLSKVIERLEDYSWNETQRIWELALLTINNEQIFISVKIYLRKFIYSLKEKDYETLNFLLESLLHFYFQKGEIEISDFILKLFDLISDFFVKEVFDIRKCLLKSLYHLVTQKNVILPKVLFKNLKKIIEESPDVKDLIDYEIILRAFSIVFKIDNSAECDFKLIRKILIQTNYNIIFSHQVLFFYLFNLVLKSNFDLCISELEILFKKLRNETVEELKDTNFPYFHTFIDFYQFENKDKLSECHEKDDYDNLLGFLCFQIKKGTGFNLNDILSLLNKTKSLTSLQVLNILEIVFENVSKFKLKVKEWLLILNELDLRNGDEIEVSNKINTSILDTDEEKILLLRVLLKFRLKCEAILQEFLKTMENQNHLIEFLNSENFMNHITIIDLEKLSLFSISNLVYLVKNESRDEILKLLVDALSRKVIRGPKDIKILEKILLKFLILAKDGWAKGINNFLICFNKLARAVGILLKNNEMQSSRKDYEKFLQNIKLIILKLGAVDSFVFGNLKNKY
jgi:hypothetical protein